MWFQQQLVPVERQQCCKDPKHPHTLKQNGILLLGELGLLKFENPLSIGNWIDGKISNHRNIILIIFLIILPNNSTANIVSIVSWKVKYVNLSKKKFKAAIIFNYIYLANNICLGLFMWLCAVVPKYCSLTSLEVLLHSTSHNNKHIVS